MFNAQNKRSELAGATEVQEDGRLKADLPIDQVEHEHILHGDLGRYLAYNLSTVWSYLSGKK